MGRDKRYPLTGIMDAFADGAGGDYHTTYFPQPTFISSRRFYCHVTTTRYLEMDFENPHYHELFVNGNPHEILIGTGSSMLEVVQNLSAYIGRQPVLPDWLRSGVILGVQGGTKRVSILVCALVTALVSENRCKTFNGFLLNVRHYVEQ